MPGIITFRSNTKPVLQFSAWLGEEGAKVTGGYGGWEEVRRPRRVALTQWLGRSPITMDIQILIDGFSNREEVETECNMLEKMAFPWGAEPPTIILFGEMVPYAAPQSDKEWVITSIQWGAAIRGMQNGKRIRQEAMVSVMSHVDVDKVKLRAAAKARKKPKKKKPPKKKPRR